MFTLSVSAEVREKPFMSRVPPEDTVTPPALVPSGPAVAIDEEAPSCKIPEVTVTALVKRFAPESFNLEVVLFSVTPEMAEVRTPVITLVAPPEPLFVNVPVYPILAFERVITPVLVELRIKFPVPVKAPDKVSPPELEDPKVAPFMVIAPARVPRVLLEFVIAPSVPEAPVPVTVIGSAPVLREKLFVSRVPPEEMVIPPPVVPVGPVVDAEEAPSFKIPEVIVTAEVKVLAPDKFKAEVVLF